MAIRTASAVRLDYRPGIVREQPRSAESLTSSLETLGTGRRRHGLDHEGGLAFVTSADATGDNSQSVLKLRLALVGDAAEDARD